MSEEFDKKIFGKYIAEVGQTPLEIHFIIDYLHEKGYLLRELKKLPEEEAKQLMIEACIFASLKLAQIESKVQFREKIRYPFS
ncbi:MAG: hypothetical protein ACK2UM_19670 [Anaerolineales bacterium]|jgi:hypothetical protein